MSEATTSASSNLNDSPRVSVITVTRNNADGLARTLASIAAQTWQPFELIVIDGRSTDHTASVIQTHQAAVTQFITQCITRVISEADLGIYDAMNKGIAAAAGDWLIFMNAGDCFDSPESLAAAMNARTPQTSVIYSDAYFSNTPTAEQPADSKQLAVCSHQSMRIIHQAMIYQKQLHLHHGSYLCMPGVTISDYLFFMAIRTYTWTKSPVVIALCEKDGVSARKGAYYQKLAVDQIAGVRSPWVTAVMLLAYPVYRVLLRPIVRMLRPSRI